MEGQALPQLQNHYLQFEKKMVQEKIFRFFNFNFLKAYVSIELFGKKLNVFRFSATTATKNIYVIWNKSCNFVNKMFSIRRKGNTPSFKIWISTVWQNSCIQLCIAFMKSLNCTA